MNYSNWYCIQVASGCEKKVRSDMTIHKAVLNDVFIESIEVAEKTELVLDKKGKRKAKKVNLLPGYVLLQVNMETVETEDGDVEKVFPLSVKTLVRDTPNVLGFTGPDKRKPRRMGAKEVKNILDRIDDAHLEVKQNVVLDYQEGDRLDVISGPFKGQEMEVVAVQGQKIVGQLEMFGRPVSAEFTPDQLYKTT